MAYRILNDKCNGCGECVEECPMDAVSVDAADKHSIDPDACTDCGSCADICLRRAISGDG
jgi:MinD superfamily P-loop ATPase